MSQELSFHVNKNDFQCSESKNVILHEIKLVKLMTEKAEKTKQKYDMIKELDMLQKMLNVTN